MKITRVQELEVYQLAFRAAMEIFYLSKQFPADEKFSLTDQIRRSSRAVCSNLSEAWRKRAYERVFKNKLSDSMQEGAETQTWLEFAQACEYVDGLTFQRLSEEYETILRKLNAMDQKASSFCF